MNKNRIKEALVLFRDGLAFSFSWLVLCTMAVFTYGGRESIPILLLIKIFSLCLWAVICFIICFRELLIRKKGFIYRLTLFYVMFIPVEVIGFFNMKLFRGNGSLKEWIIFAILIISLYVACVLIDWIVCRKRGESYTRSLLAYNERRSYEQSAEDGSKH